MERVALANDRPFVRKALEARYDFGGSLCEGHGNHGRNGKPEFCGVQCGMVFFDHPSALKYADAAETGRRGQPYAICNLFQRISRVRPQRTKDFQINFVELRRSARTARGGRYHRLAPTSSMCPKRLIELSRSKGKVGLGSSLLPELHVTAHSQGPKKIARVSYDPGKCREE